LNAKEVAFSLVLKEIYKDDLVTEFVNVFIASGLTRLHSGATGSIQNAISRV